MSKMIYKQYSDNDVFASKYINVVCNQLMQGLLDADFDNFNAHFGLSGDAALCFLNEDVGPISNVQFKTDNREVYLFLAHNLSKITPDILSLQIFEERIIAEFKDSFLEFYLVASISTSNHLGIYIAL